MVRNYFKIAWRNSLKNKVSSFINIGGLSDGNDGGNPDWALGMG